MAGGSQHADNPLPLNVVPLIDIIFCLLLFFMCSFHFKALEGKMDAWLPLDKGGHTPVKGSPPIEDLRVRISYNSMTQSADRYFGRTSYPDDIDLGNVLKDHYQSFVARGKVSTPVVLEVDPQVAWADVFRVMDLVQSRELPALEFSLAKSDLELK